MSDNTFSDPVSHKAEWGHTTHHMTKTITFNTVGSKDNEAVTNTNLFEGQSKNIRQQIKP